MKLIEKILEFLDTDKNSDFDFPKKWPRSYKGVTVGFMGILTFKDTPSSSIRSTLFRLKKNNFINRDDKNNFGWKITALGKKYIKSKKKKLQFFENPFKKSDSKNLLLIFDVPE